MTHRQLFDADTEAPADYGSVRDRLVVDAVRRGGGHVPEIRLRLERAGVAIGQVRGVEDLGAVAVLDKDAVPELQAAEPPFGGMLAVRPAELERIYVSPGPILDPQGTGPDFWRIAPAAWAAGFRAGDVVLNTFSYHLTPGGMMLDGALRAVGCVVIPGGVGNTAGQAELARSADAVGYAGTPQFLLTLLERAAEETIGLKLRRALVSGAAFPPALRATLESDHGVDAYECYATADAGLLGYQCPAKEGWHIAPGVVIELLDPATGAPARTGEPGQVVVTKPSAVYPLVRFGTGDLSALLDAACDCGRTTPRLTGFLGRVGEGVKVRGMFVHPRALDRGLADLESVARYQARVDARDHRDELVVWVEAVPGSTPDLDRVRASIEQAIRLRADVQLVEGGTIADDAARIVDLR